MGTLVSTMVQWAREENSMDYVQLSGESEASVYSITIETSFMETEDIAIQIDEYDEQLGKFKIENRNCKKKSWEEPQKKVNRLKRMFETLTCMTDNLNETEFNLFLSLLCTQTCIIGTLFLKYVL